MSSSPPRVSLAQQSLGSAPPSHVGWLSHEGHGTQWRGGHWTRRYFVLQGGRLEYFIDDTCGEPIGSIPLTAASLVELGTAQADPQAESAKIRDKTGTIQLKTSRAAAKFGAKRMHDKYFLRAEGGGGAEACSEWRDALELHIQFATESEPKPRSRLGSEPSPRGGSAAASTCDSAASASALPAFLRGVEPPPPPRAGLEPPPKHAAIKQPTAAASSGVSGSPSSPSSGISGGRGNPFGDGTAGVEEAPRPPPPSDALTDESRRLSDVLFQSLSLEAKEIVDVSAESAPAG